MKIQSISINNLEKLYSIILDKNDNQDYSNRQFERNMIQLYNHISVNFALEEVSSYEYIFLKMFASDITKFIPNEKIDKSSIEKKYPEIFATFLDGYIDFLDDTKKSDYDLSDFVTPSGIIEGTCSVFFSGSQLIAITDLNPELFFKEATRNKCIKSQTNTEIIWDKDYLCKMKNDYDIENYFIKKFILKFYRFMTEKITYIDLLSDYGVDTYFKNSTKDLVFLESVSTPYTIFNFKSDTEDNLMKRKKICQKNWKNLDEKMNFAKMYFQLYLPFGAFIRLFNLLPYKKFTMISNFSIPNYDSFTNNKLRSDFLSNPIDQYNQWIELFGKKVQSAYSDLSKKLQLYQMTLNNADFTFNIALTFEDINKYISPELDKYSGEQKNVLNIIYKNALHSIIHKSKLVYSLA